MSGDKKDGSRAPPNRASPSSILILLIRLKKPVLPIAPTPGRGRECVTPQVLTNFESYRMSGVLSRKSWVAGPALTRVLAQPAMTPGSDVSVSIAAGIICIFGSHFHPFELAGLPAATAMRSGNLPMAIPLARDPNKFEDLLGTAKGLLKIRDIGKVPRPKWIERLLRDA